MLKYGFKSAGRRAPNDGLGNDDGFLKYISRRVVAVFLKVLSFLRFFIRRRQHLENVHSRTATAPSNLADLQTIKEDRVNPCLERLDRLESMFNQLSRKPPELPQDKDRAIQDSFDRIKSIEFDLEKTKKVPAKQCFMDLMLHRIALGFRLYGSSAMVPFISLLFTKQNLCSLSGYAS